MEILHFAKLLIFCQIPISFKSLFKQGDHVLVTHKMSATLLWLIPKAQ